LTEFKLLPKKRKNDKREGVSGTGWKRGMLKCGSRDKNNVDGVEV